MPDESIDDLRARAAQYREMARTAASDAIANSLLRLAERFEVLAKQQEDDGDSVA
jgi:molecular chaperone GrpE (heat shock protein)